MASEPNDPPARQDSHDNPVGLPLLEHIVADQKAIWTGPFHVRMGNTPWLVPLAGITAGFLVTDRDTSAHLPNDPHTLKRYRGLSNYGVFGMAGASGGLYLWGKMTSNDHKQETGVLAGEAAVDSLAVVTALKYATQRERPLDGGGQGKFWHGGDSFPSDHAAVAWSTASVVAHEYPGLLPKILAYGAAAAVSAARVQAKQHFPSDVFVASGIGWLTGWQVYRAHHNPEVGGGEWENLLESSFHGTERQPSAMGSPYVPLDSWVNPAFDRLMALGYVSSGIVGQRPWTRLECARLLNEASDRLLEGTGEAREASRLLSSLREEFSADLGLLGGGENNGLRLESVYTRFTEIAGKPLADGLHLGETLVNDFGRPYQEGFNNVTGFSGWATAGRWVVYARTEYQHSPSAPAYSQPVRNFIAQADTNPVLPAIPTLTRNQARLLDAYVGLNLGDWQISYGPQSQWWGPGRSGPFLMSNDAEPVLMFHIDRVTPFKLPGFLHYLGPMRTDAFFGYLAGHQYPAGPYIHGEKVSFKPTPNLEFGFTRTVVLGGVGRPLTLNRIWRSYISVTSGNFTPQNDPGKRTGGFDLTYRVPFVRNWLTLYTDSIADDDPSPLAAPRRAGINPGIYMPQLPGLRKLDLRVEAAYTDVPAGITPGQFIYFDSFYHDLYTNKGHLIGSWVGRDGTGIQAWSRCWLSSHNSIQWGYRHDKVNAKFLPGGGTINDASIRGDFWLRSGLSLTASVQYEKWKYPLLAVGAQSDVASSFGFTFWPHGGKP